VIHVFDGNVCVSIKNDRIQIDLPLIEIDEKAES